MITLVNIILPGLQESPVTAKLIVSLTGVVLPPPVTSTLAVVFNPLVPSAVIVAVSTLLHAIVNGTVTVPFLDTLVPWEMYAAIVLLDLNDFKSPPVITTCPDTLEPLVHLYVLLSNLIDWLLEFLTVTLAVALVPPVEVAVKVTLPALTHLIVIFWILVFLPSLLIATLPVLLTVAIAVLLDPIDLRSSFLVLLDIVTLPVIDLPGSHE